MPATDAARTAIGAIQDERADQSARTYKPRTDKRPSGRQMYAIAFGLLELAGIDAPKTSADASAIIGQLREQRDAMTAAAAGTEIPF
jgi:hypothetical protein